MLLLLAAPHPVAASPVSTNDDVFLSVTDVATGMSRIEEYTPANRYVRTISVPKPGGITSFPQSEYLRGIAVNSSGQIVGFNGTFVPELATFHPDTQTFTSRTSPGWDIGNKVSSGSVATFQNFAFVVSDNLHNLPCEVLRFNPDGTSQQFGTGADYGAYINLTVGPDGKLYVLYLNASQAYCVDVYDPVSLQLLRTIILQVPAQNNGSESDLTSLAVDASGGIYVTDIANYVYHLDAGGVLLQTGAHGYSGYTTDIKIDPVSGRILISVTGPVGAILQTNATLSTFATVIQLDRSLTVPSAFIAFGNAALASALNRTSTSHLLWNNVDGRVMLWSVAADGTFTLNGFGPYTDNAPQNKWSATALATGPDGKSHILWNNTDGRVMLWTIDDQGNFTLTGYGPYTDNSVGANPAANKWSATAVSIGPDNVVHLLWNNTDHRIMLWNVAPDFSFTLAGYGPYTDTSVSSDPGNLWSATALATGPDNKSRIVWNNADGRVMLWNVDSAFNFTLAGYGPYTDDSVGNNPAANKWSAVGVSVGPDNVTHLLWGNTDLRAMFWNVAADFSFTLAGFGPYNDLTMGNPSGDLWSATALATGPDGLSEILWKNTDYRAMLWGVSNAFDVSQSVPGYGPYTDNASGSLWSTVAVSAGP